MAVLDEVRVIPEHLRSTYRALKPFFAAGERCATHGETPCG
jgi:hypothetical protein